MFKRHRKRKMVCGAEPKEFPMNTEESISTLEERISKAVADCEAWRQTGFSESYMEAYDLVEALQLQLRRRLRLPVAAAGDGRER
ncbi:MULTISPECIES: hypothetical protein [unclassified Variovorax]|uniref:hypothetical protein n=2 Tax=Variovorax TaxID=34072 RepID=UPI000837D047|nr:MULTISPECIES: hypothetical protein [unclassified Variovorax]